MKTLISPVQSIPVSTFHDVAKRIPDSPYDRLPKYAADTFRKIKRGDRNAPGIMIDVHAHAFTYRNIPEDFLKYRRWLSRTLRKAAGRLFKPSFMRAFEADTPANVVKGLLKKYFDSPYHNFAIKDTFIVLLMMDMERGIRGAIEEPFPDQVRQVCKLVSDFKFAYDGKTFDGNKHLIPFLAIDPHNPDAFKYFLSAFIKDVNLTEVRELNGVAPFCGVKVYPALGYVPYHPTLLEVFKVCEAKGIPVVSHTGGHRTHASYDAIEVLYRSKQDGVDIDKRKTISLRGMNKSHFSRFFLHPHHWKHVLDRYPNLRLNLAHFGSNADWYRYRNGNNSMVHRTKDIIRGYKSVYADLSYSFYHKVNIRKMREMMATDRDVRDKILYGSDYYLCDIEHQSVSDFYNNVNEIITDSQHQRQLFYANAIDFLVGK